MTELQQNRYDQLLRRVGDLKGPGSKVNDALTELFPMFDVENVPAELLLLMGTRLCLGGESLSAPGVTLFNQAMLRNPVGSGALITLLEIQVSSTVAQRYVWGPTLNTFANAEPTAFVDGRVFGQGTVGQVLTEALLVVGPEFGTVRVQGNTPLKLAVPRGLAVLSPGTAFAISTTSADTALHLTFTWIERTAQPSELNL